MTNPAVPAAVSKPQRTAKGIREFVVLFIALSVLLTALYGQRGLNEPDEGRYANIAINFVDHPGSPLEPRMSGFGHYDKPSVARPKDRLALNPVLPERCRRHHWVSPRFDNQPYV